MWRGSHRDADGLTEPVHGNWPISAAWQARRKAAGCGPMRLQCPAGAVAFRDHRSVHRGLPNTGATLRQMVSLNYCAKSVFAAPDL